MAGKTHVLKKPKELPEAAAATRWHAVAIRPKGSSCEAVQARRTARYLSKEAPRLPLAECTSSDACSCVYKHHADRRVQSRRRAETGEPRRNAKVAQERRSERDRRKPD